MCLILLSWRAHPDYPLIVAANRDEFHARPAAPAEFWQDQPSILAGRDLEAGGTWMGVSRGGRFAAVTNYRGAREPSAAESRGALVAGFLKDEVAGEEYVGDVMKKSRQYSGFNLLACDGEELWWASNRDSGPRRLEPGVYALGNLLLDSPEVESHKLRFRDALDPAPAVESLAAVLAPARIVNQQYGTRCSSMLLSGADRRLRYAERIFLASGEEDDTRQYEFSVASQ